MSPLTDLSSAIDQRLVNRNANTIYVTSSFNIVQSIENQIKFLHKISTKLFIFNISVVCDDFKAFRLIKLVYLLSSYQCFAHPHMLPTKKKLSIKITDIDCVKIHYFNFSETGENKHLHNIKDLLRNDLHKGIRKKKPSIIHSRFHRHLQPIY